MILKRENLFIMSLFACALLPIPCAAAELPAATVPDYESMEEYAAYIEAIEQYKIDSNENGQYILYDIDQDGIRELIISSDVKISDWENDVYTLSDEGSPVFVDSFPGYADFYEDEEYCGLYAVSGRKRFQNIDWITKDGMELYVENIESRRELGPDEDYFSNEYPVLWKSFYEEYQETDTGYNYGYGNSCSYETVLVAAPDGGVNLRRGAGVEYEKALPYMIPNGTQLYVAEKMQASNGNYWGLTNYDGEEGWIALTQTQQVIECTRFYVVEVTAPDGGVNMRAAAGAEFEKLLPDMIPNGTRLMVSETAQASNGNDWGFVEYNNVQGWIAMTQVTVIE